jgi:glycosyltransferase involved in cell wall biosynthesis
MLLSSAFWTCLGAVLYVYAGYPALVALLGWIAGREIRKADVLPRVSVLISAYNEEREIGRTITNKLDQDYPAENLEVIVVSDSSSDATDGIVQALVPGAGGRLRFLRQEPRQGKTKALNSASALASGEILVFSDANSIYARDAIRRLVRNFADPTVGYVTGQMVYTVPDGAGIGDGSGAYMRYENLLRVLETRVHSVVGVDGGIDAVRKELFRPMRADQLPDFVLPLDVVEQHRRVVYEAEARVYEVALAAAGDEFRMRVRVTLRALWALLDKRALLSPLSDPVFAWQLLSHKVMRYLAFVPLAGLLLSNGLLADSHPLYLALLCAQVLAYALALLGHFLSRSASTPSLLLAPYYFALLNLACAAAVWRFVNGQKMTVWKPRRGA